MYMFKRKPFYSAISLMAVLFSGCITGKREFCDCTDLRKAVTDNLTLSPDQLEDKQKGCQWIQDELSPMEIATRFAQCNIGNNPKADTAAQTSGNNPAKMEEVAIGSQTWTTANLYIDHYRNGDPIPEVQDSAEWANLTTGAWCYFQNDAAAGKVYGKLYNWYAVNDRRGLSPDGWRIPSNADWKTLIDGQGGTSTAGSTLKESGTTHWNAPNSDGVNSSGFNGISAGDRAFFGSFIPGGIYAQWWSSSSDSAGNGSVFELSYSGGDAVLGSAQPRVGFYVRCVKN
jgi:uncharacterized protein (TIGR02145 family)